MGECFTYPSWFERLGCFIGLHSYRVLTVACKDKGKFIRVAKICKACSKTKML